MKSLNHSPPGLHINRKQSLPTPEQTLKNVSATVTDEIPPFGRNDLPVGGLRGEETVIPTKGRNLLLISATLLKGISRKIFHGLPPTIFTSNIGISIKNTTFVGMMY
ncbi:hypothetical protein [Viscerimonas tarda]